MLLKSLSTDEANLIWKTLGTPIGRITPTAGLSAVTLSVFKFKAPLHNFSEWSKPHFKNGCLSDGASGPGSGCGGAARLGEPKPAPICSSHTLLTCSHFLGSLQMIFHSPRLRINDLMATHTHVCTSLQST